MTVRRPVLEDIEYLTNHLRTEDVREIEAHGSTVREGLWDSLCNSVRAFVVTYEERPVLIFGISEDNPPGIKRCAVWMVGTPEVKRISRLFLRHSREWVAEIAQGYDLLWNVVDCRNSLHHRWLRWCGFTFLRMLPVGPGSLPFYEFVLKP